MYISTVKITSKGQISLPKKVRDMFKSNVVSLEINDTTKQVVLSPIHDLAGSLAKYKKDTPLSFAAIRDQSWQDNVMPNKNEKTNNK